MQKKLIILYAVVLCPTMTSSMEKQPQKTLVKEIKDVLPFVGKIVTFTGSPYNKKFINPKFYTVNGARCGYVQEVTDLYSDKFGFPLIMLLHKGEPSIFLDLSNKSLTLDTVYLGLTEPKDVCAIQKAIQSGDAFFGTDCEVDKEKIEKTLTLAEKDEQKKDLAEDDIAG